MSSFFQNFQFNNHNRNLRGFRPRFGSGLNSNTGTVSSPNKNVGAVGGAVGSAGVVADNRVASNVLRQYADATLGSGSLRHAVLLPPGEDVNEWVAVHVVDFYNQINMLYGTITEFCTPSTCPHMSATEEYEYLWQDAASANSKYRKPCKVSAPGYIELLMSWVQAYIDDDALFPASPGVPFSKGSPAVFKNILKRLFRVYAHIYCHHFDQITEMGLQPHLNTSLKHFVLFAKEFKLVDDKEFAPLQELITILLADPQTTQ